MIASQITFEELTEGQAFEERYEITQSVYDHFLAAFGDRSPIHVDPAYANDRGFPAIVMPGAILNGFVSHFVGMRVPGRNALLLSVDIRYRQPCYLGERIEIRAHVAHKLVEQRAVVLHLTFFNETQNKKVANAVVTVKVAHG